MRGGREMEAYRLELFTAMKASNRYKNYKRDGKEQMRIRFAARWQEFVAFVEKTK